MSVIGSNILAGASGQTEYNLTRSLRFRQSASAYLNRTPASSPTSNQKGTFSFWFKRGLISYGTEQWFFSSGATSFGCYIQTADRLGIEYFGGSYLITTQVFRDPSAWYHVVIAIDSTQATASNRAKVYVNGVQVTSFSTEQYPSQNATFNWMANGQACFINQIYSTGRYFDGYMAEWNYIDGQQLTPSSFGANSSTTGVWQPKKYAGTYGTNGFYLPFTNNASTTTLGNDFSGNGNNWTTNNISLTAGSTYDSMTDVPTLTSATAANFAVLNPVQKSSSVTVSQGNLYGVSSAGNQTLPTTIYANSGKWYAEFTCATAGLEDMIGIITDTFNFTSGFYQANQLLVARSSGDIFYSSASTFGGPSWTTGDIIQVKLDLDNQTVGWAKNGGSYTTATITSYDGHTAGKFWTFAIKNGVSGGTGNFYYNLNCGQRPFAYTPPTGFVALNTFNLPTPTIGATASTQANKYFDATTYTGNGGALTVTNAGGFQPDLVWAKSRSNAYDNVLVDSRRGVSNILISSLTNAEQFASNFWVTGFTSNGFTVAGQNATGANGATYVGWQWKGGGTGVTNTAGSITSTVSANTSAGFSIVTYTATGSNATVGHGLGVAPKMVIVKRRDGTSDWIVWQTALSGTEYLGLNLTNAKYTASPSIWNSTTPTSSVFSIGTSGATNPSGATMVAYCFSEVAGYSKFGSYTGNGSTDGTFVHLGFRPKYVLTKSSTSAYNWYVEDTSRSTFNAVGATLAPSTSGSEDTAWGATKRMDILSNGFKIRISSLETNESGATFIYMAFAENPFKYSLAR